MSHLSLHEIEDYVVYFHEIKKLCSVNKKLRGGKGASLEVKTVIVKRGV